MAASPTPLQNPNAGKARPGAYQIGGVPVEFPYKPYGSQLAFMGRVIHTLDRARRQGRCHALLESPTGTGKSLSLLCSSLAWQRHQTSRFLSGHAAPSQGLPPPPTSDPLVSGGGFIPETQPSNDAEQSSTPASARAQRRQTSPKIYYATRTHSQITQVIREYRKTSYRVPMAVLASRKHYCTNKFVCTKANLDEECKLLLKGEALGCSEFKNANKVKNHPSLQKGGCYEVHDIEDLVKVGKSVKGCSYFAAQTLAEEAQLVFCPYSYIVNPIVRRAMDIDLKGAIVILDEAHNIEDIARDSGSLDVEEDVLFALQAELGQLCMADNDAAVYQPLYDIIQGIISWMGERKMGLQQCEFEHYSSFWTADKAISELQHAGITQQCFPILQECATKAIKATSDAESVESHLSGMSAIALEGLFSSLTYLFSGDGTNATDYQLGLQRYVKRDNSNAVSDWICKLSLWCLNPALVFREIANLSLSVILTSGTLSPMGSFASELGVQFEACMEAPHVIDPESQLWAAVVSTGPGNCQLNASYRTADGFAFQDGLGVTLEEICKIAPGGILVFFPSYKLLEKLRRRWTQTGQWSRLNAEKPLFVEPRGATDEFDSLLRGYYDAIRGSTKVVHEKSRLGSRRTIKQPCSKVCSQNTPRGAAFLAVCRGKVSEGIDFSDENARVVVVVGIPFPNKNDIQVMLKKKYNDTHRSTKHLLSGSEWYCHQAFRALNQAAGRCIRHRFDYGAIIFLDERFKEERNLTYISKWLKNSIKYFHSFNESLVGLQNFFESAQKRFGPASSHSRSEDVSLIEKDPDFSEQNSNLNQGIQLQKTKKDNVNYQNARKMSNQNGAVSAKLTKSSKLDKKGPFLKDQSQNGVEGASETIIKCLNPHTDFADLKSSTTIQFQCLETISAKSCKADLHQPLATTNSIVRDHNATPKSLEVEMIQQTVGNFSPKTISIGSISDTACTPEHSPEDIKETDSLNMSVNSYNHKRKRINLQMSVCNQIDCLSSDTDSFYPVDSISSISRETDLIPESPCLDNSSVNRQRKLIGNVVDTLTKMLEVSCLYCRSPLGLQENDLLVNCSLTSSSKVYLAYVLKHGPPKDSSFNYTPTTPERDVPVVVCDSSSVNHRVFDNGCKEAVSHGIWSEKDSCVFRSLICPFCTVPRCLGVQIIAADASNSHLLNKVLLFADHLDINDQQKPNQKDVTPICSTVPGKESASLEIEKYAYTPTLPKPDLNTRKLKQLSLPKRVECSLEHQDVL
ncbi:Fanconi anemia group J protein homolog isoform X1 [Zingiber officinale]|uniref:Fanconi anemia group J protein homolog isoform X1 n=1 Tax=Zingiber officinale TaxID=94328 RepID=UPI001C4B40E3|nr:Fanconi anemia group J protein homolog isoform X1 [Zingiber officinale]